MTIINGVKQDAEEPNVWAGGLILDPANGKTYKVRLKVDRRRQEAGGARLHRLADVRPHADLDPRRVSAKHDPGPGSSVLPADPVHPWRETK